MKAFSSIFEIEPVTDHPHKPRQWESVKQAQSAYLEFCLTCQNFKNTPAVLKLYVGECADVESTEVWPEQHDMELRFTAFGSVRMFRTSK